MKTFADTIKSARESKGLLLRQVAAALEIDQAIISKFERGARKPTKEQVKKFADYYKIEKHILLTLWLSDKIFYSIVQEDYALEALKAAEEKVKYLKITNHGK